MNKSEFVLWCCIGYIVGIFSGSFLDIYKVFLLFFLIILFLFLKHKNIIIICFCVLFLIIGVQNYKTAIYGLEKPELEKFYNQKVDFIGCVIQDPDIGISNTRLKVQIEQSDANALITTNLYPKVKYGDVLQINGVFNEIPVFEGFDYRDYLKTEKTYFLMHYPDIQILGKNCGNLFQSIAISFKNKLNHSLEKVVPMPAAGFFQALLFGDENNISQKWKDKLNITGTRHIAAVSGANITIISIIILDFLLFLGFWRKHALWSSLILIFFYILMIGAPACGIRAGIMGGLLLLAQNFGRLANPERLIVFSLTFMLIFNPMLLKHDIGFQLSFLAFSGLIYLGAVFSKILGKLKIPKFFEIRLTLASTLAAQIFCLPILLYNFGQFSLVSPLTNILILPAITFLTISGFLFAFIGIFSQILGQILSWPAQILMMFVMKIIDVFSNISWASKQIQISGIFVIISYFVLAIFVYYLKKKQKLWFLDY